MRECSKCGTCYDDETTVCPIEQGEARISLPGTTLLANRYRLVKRIGRGAMGNVYLANDKNLGTRQVALKTVRQDILNSENLQEGEAIARFEREALSAASISHPHTVDVTDFGETDDGIFYLVMEYVEGETLHKLLRREGTLSVGRAVELLRQISDGMEAAHNKGILHRDLKPANIFIMKKGRGDGFVKVGDFGLAKIVSQTVTDISSSDTPSSRGIIGTPEFMSPEQMQPELGVDARADLYALGTIAYLMLGGKTPFTGDVMQLIMQKIMHEPPPLSDLRSDVPKAVEKVIMSALAIKPDDRPNTVADWITQLEDASEGVDEKRNAGTSRLVIMAPVGAEVYINDERKGSIGSSGRLILSTVPAGQHVLRVSKLGEKDDERVIEIREGANEQVIQAQLRPLTGSLPSPSQSGGSSSGAKSSLMPGIVACTKCNSRFAEGAKFCGRCSNTAFVLISQGEQASSTSCPRCSAQLPPNARFCGRCGLSFGQQTSQMKINRQVGFKSNVQLSPPSMVEKVCRNCGASYPPHIKFCGKCGNSL